jgi:hypothetical protein
VEDGHYGTTRLDGLNFSLLCDWPGAIHEGNGQGLALIDERADQAQREAIASLLSGTVGGPWAIVVQNTLTKVHGPKFVPYEVKVAAQQSVVRAGDSLTLEMEPIRNRVTGAEAHPRIVLPEGFIFKEGTLASSRLFQVRDGISYEYSGKNTSVAAFEYQAP